ncbi:DUF2339 domain-containing protein [candidate division CSSED10-310 bacterium]|uniref:DUF2339 domain-containing protein n=1 Tax=candidate division CSSED10-310 bacterium TaxID=2855610 RepID=A0ABV6YVK4_UNCC1
MMKCPACQSDIRQNEPVCPTCGFQIDLNQTFEMLKSGVSSIKSDTFSLTDRINQMEKQFAKFEALLSKAIPTAKQPWSKPEKSETRPRPSTKETAAGSDSPQTVKAARTESSPSRDGDKSRSSQVRVDQSRISEIKFGQKWLLIAGVVTTVLAVGWFLKYSFEQNWIGPAGRVSMAYLTGMVFLGAGEFFRRKSYHLFGLVIVGGGVATLYFATFAAFQVYQLLSQPLSFGIMIIITMLAGTMSLTYDTRWLAVLGLIGGFLTPVILSTGENNQIALMTYMTILNAGILSIAFFKQWRLLNNLGNILTWLLFTGWYFNHYSDAQFWRTLIFLNIFFLTYAFVPFVYHVVREHHQHLRGIGMIVPNSFIAFGFSFTMIESHFRVEAVSIVTLIYACIFLWMAHFIYGKDRAQAGAFIMLLAKATLFLFLTIPILFSDHWITLFWAIQAVVMLWSSLKLRNKWLFNGFVILIFLTVSKFFLYDYVETFHLDYDKLHFRGGFTRTMSARFISAVTVLIALYKSSRLLEGKILVSRLFRGHGAVVLWSSFTISLFLVLNIEVGAFFGAYASAARFAALSVLWAFFSIVLISIGFLKNKSLVRHCALGLFAITLMKVFFVDMAHVSTPYRIISFTVVGMLLIGASYLYHRFKDRIMTSMSPESNKE